MPNPLVVIAGPTASGKSALGMWAAQRFNGEIICADSRTVYKGLDIGTAKPSLHDQQVVPHHLLDIVEPGQEYTVATFKTQATAAIDDIVARGRLPIMVGGTGLYIDSVIFDYQFGQPADPGRRAELQQMSIEALQKLCQDSNIPLPHNSKNKRHLVRAIELGGLAVRQQKLRLQTLVVGITTDRATLRERIGLRAAQMVDEGVLEEVKKAGEKYQWCGEAFTGNIYRALRPVVEGSLSLKEGIENFITSDMQLAKRQVTWLKRNPHVVWGGRDELKQIIEHFVQQNIQGKSIPLSR